MGDFYSHRLDRSRPLWEITLLDGLAGGRWSLVTKVHHCLVDGMSGVSVTNLLLDDSPAPSPSGRCGTRRPRPRGERPAKGRPRRSRGARVPASAWRPIPAVRVALGQARASQGSS